MEYKITGVNIGIGEVQITYQVSDKDGKVTIDRAVSIQLTEFTTKENVMAVVEESVQADIKKIKLASAMADSMKDSVGTMTVEK